MTLDNANNEAAYKYIERVDDWMSTLEIGVEFDDSFVRSIETQLGSGRRISDKQLAALENICNGWKIP